MDISRWSFLPSSTILSTTSSVNMGLRKSRSLSSSSSASPRVAGSMPMPLSRRSPLLILNMSSCTGSPGSLFFLMPSIPAPVTAAKTRYGFDEGSGARNSSRFSLACDTPLKCLGTRTIAERLLELHAM